MIYVPEREALAAGDVVELVTKQPVPSVGQQVKQELSRWEQKQKIEPSQGGDCSASPEAGPSRGRGVYRVTAKRYDG